MLSDSILRSTLVVSTISLQARCSASLHGTPSSPRRLRQVVVAHHTAPQLRAQRPLPADVSCKTFSPAKLAHAIQTYVFFLSVRLSSTSCSPTGVQPRRQAAPAYRERRDSMPSWLCFDSIWRRRSVGRERGRWFCRGVVSVFKCWNREVARDGLRDSGAKLMSLSRQLRRYRLLLSDNTPSYLGT